MSSEVVMKYFLSLIVAIVLSFVSAVSAEERVQYSSSSVEYALSNSDPVPEMLMDQLSNK